MFYDYFRVTGAHDTVLEYADLFSVSLHHDNVQEFDTRWDEVLLSMSKTSMPNYQKLKTMVRKRKDQKLRLRNFDARHGKLKQEQWSRVERDQVSLKVEKVLVISGKKKANVRRETSAVSSLRVTIVHNKNPNPNPNAATFSEP